MRGGGVSMVGCGAFITQDKGRKKEKFVLIGKRNSLTHKERSDSEGFRDRGNGLRFASQARGGGMTV